MNHHFYLQNISVSTLFEKQKNVEFLALFGRQVSTFAPNLASLFQEIKQLKKTL